MILLLALFIPIAIGLIAFLISGRKITPKELALQEGIVIVVVIVMYYVMLSGKTGDTEFLNGQVTEKHTDTQGCCHSYPCNCHNVCSGSGQNRSCSEHCDTCYQHSHDVFWEASSSTGSQVYYNGCNGPYSDTPHRYDLIYVGEPTAEEHGYTNYIKGNPNSILRREAVSPSLLAQVPEYPTVYDYYRANRVLDLGVQGVDVDRLNHELGFINAQLGAKRQVDIILIITKESDQTFAEAIRQKWLGGKKNDVVVVIGAPAFPQIAWVDTVSWTQEEGMKINIRDNILAMGTFDGHKALGIIAFEIDNGFKRRHMRDFQYLQAGIEPSTNQTFALFLVAALLSIIFSIVNWQLDLFDEERPTRKFY